MNMEMSMDKIVKPSTGSFGMGVSEEPKIIEVGSEKINRDSMESKRETIKAMVFDTAELIKNNGSINRERMIAQLYIQIRDKVEKEPNFVREAIESITLPEHRKHLAEVIEEIKRGKRNN